MAVREILSVLVGNEARKSGKSSGILGFGLGMIATRIAMRSLPGAIFVGGALVAKALYDNAQEEEDVPAADQIIDIEGKPVSEKPD